MSRPGPGAGIDRVAAFVRDNKRVKVADITESQKHFIYTLTDGRRHKLTPADRRKLPEGYPRS